MNKFLTGLAFFLTFLSPQAFSVTLAELENQYELDRGFVGIIYDKQADKLYFKLDNLDQDFIYMTSLPAGLGSNAIGLDRGQLTETRLAAFERVGNKVFLKQKNTRYRANSKNFNERLAVEQAFSSSILWGFPLVDSGNGWVLVDASEFLLQDIHGAGQILHEKNQGENYRVDPSRSGLHMPRTTSFQDNSEVEATITLVGQKPGDFLKQVAADPQAISLKMHHSFIRLPDNGYQPRTHHPKSGYWAVSFKDFAQPLNASLDQRLIGRHRLSKKEPKASVSEAVKPIVYYLDPGVPEPVRSAIIDGAMWWSQAFEAIGYKNAFQVKDLPANADPMDIRYNVIQWVHRATRGWSYGFGVTDPRTGEIIKGHVTLGSQRARHDYLIAQAMTAPFSQNEDDQALVELALARIRQLAAHEVGHTLGLDHNFAGSLNNSQSVMDYPHPRFDLTGNKITFANPYQVGLGDWDKAAIVYGYQTFEAGQEKSALLKQIATNDLNQLLFISDADARDPSSPHAFASLWDNGRNAVNELERIKQIRQVALANLGGRSLKSNQFWSELAEMVLPVYFSHRYQLTAAAKWLGGLEYEYSDKRNNPGYRNSVVSGENQTLAMKALLSTLAPEFLELPGELVKQIPPRASGLPASSETTNASTGVAFDPIGLAEASAQNTLSLLFNSSRLSRLLEQGAIDPTIPSIESITTEIHQQIIEQNFDGIRATIHQSVVDLIYSNYLNLLYDKNTSQQVRMQIFGVLLTEKGYLQRKLTAVRRTSSYYGFYAYQANRLEQLKPEVQEQLIQLPEMPPGAPI